MEYQYLYVFCVGFLQTGLKALSILSITKTRYLAAGAISIGITLTWAYGLLKIVEDPSTIPFFVVGCSLGVMFSMWIEHYLSKKKEVRHAMEKD